MRDLLFVLITVGFFALASLYIRGCAALTGDRAGAVVRADRVEADRAGGVDPSRPASDKGVAR